MLMVIPDSMSHTLIVEIVPPDYGKTRRDEIKKVLIAYFAMLEYSLKTGLRPNIMSEARMNTIDRALNVIQNRTSEHIQNLQRDNSYIIGELAEKLSLDDMISSG